MKTLNWITIGAILFTTHAYGQGAYDALQFSQFLPGGTARSLGLSGAMGAVGADQGALEVNPAAIGFYRRSEFTVTPDVVITNSSTNLYGSAATDNHADFVLSNAGFVISHMLNGGRHGRWQSFNWGLTMNKTADFNSTMSYVNTSSTNSVLAGYETELNKANPPVGPSSINLANGFSGGAVSAFNNYLLNPSATDSTQYTAVTDGANVNQQMYVHTSGGIYNLALTFGSNWNNTLYFGGSLNIPILNYHQFVSISESANSGASDGFENYSQNNTYNTSGVGVDAKFGVIYKPNNWVRVGASIITPTYYHLNENYSTNTVANFDTVSYSDQNYPEAGAFSYHLTTPFRFIGSAAAFFKQYGFLSVDYQYANYSDARFTYNGDNSEAQAFANSEIASTLGAAHTIRVGLELAPVSIFRLRGGFSYTTSPIESSQETDGANYILKTYSGGFGFRFHRVYLDFAYIRYVNNTATIFSGADVGNNNNISASNLLKQDNVVMTLGFNFAAHRGNQEYVEQPAY